MNEETTTNQLLRCIIFSVVVIVIAQAFVHSQEKRRTPDAE